MRVLVPGGAGYIGSHTAKLLAEAGHTPIVFDKLLTGHRWAVKWGPFVEGDLGDAALIRRVLVDYEIDAVIHFAASAYVGESVENPRKYFENNAMNSLNLINAMVDTGVRTIIFSSTCAVYGIPERVPIDEGIIREPINPYGDSKLFVEQVLHAYGEAYGLSWVALRYFNAAGADPAGEIGEVHDPESHLIPLIIFAALGTRGPIQVFGTDYPTPDGTAIRDYIHVNDLGSAHLKALDYLVEGGENRAMNLGTGRGHSVREVIESVERVSGCNVPYELGPRRPGDPPELVADATRARDLLGWEPAFTDLDEIVATAWNWHTSRSSHEK